MRSTRRIGLSARQVCVGDRVTVFGTRRDRYHTVRQMDPEVVSCPPESDQPSRHRRPGPPVFNIKVSAVRSCHAHARQRSC